MSRLWTVFVAALLAGFPASALPQVLIDSVELTAAGGARGDGFGRSVAISGNTLVVGAPGRDERGEDSGAAYVFVRDGRGQWTHRQTLLAAELAPYDHFGWSVAIDGDSLVIGAPGDRRVAGVPDPMAPSRGAAYVFQRIDGWWRQVTRLQPEYLVAADRFGWAVAASGDAIAVSAPYRDLYSWQADWGLVVVFRRTASGWATEAELTGWGGHAGFSLSLDGDDVAFGAPGYGYGMVHRWHRNPDGQWTSWPSGGRRVDGQGALAGFGEARMLTRGPDGRLFVLDGPAVRRISGDGTVDTVFVAPEISAPTLSTPYTVVTALTVDRNGKIWMSLHRCLAPGKMCSLYEYQLRRYESGGTSTLVASGQSLASLAPHPSGGVLGLLGCSVVHVSDSGNYTTLAGDRTDCVSSDGVEAARFQRPLGLVAAPGGLAYVTEPYSLRRLDLETGAVDTLLPLPNAGLVAAAADGSLWLASTQGYSAVDVYRPAGGALGPAVVDSPVEPARSIDGGPGVAVIKSFSPQLSVAAADGELAFTDGQRVGLVSSDGVVRTLAGSPRVPDGTSEAYGYSLAMRRGRVLSGAPRAPLAFAPPELTGAATSEERELASTRQSVLQMTSARERSRYGASLAWLGEKDVAVGPANGCLWLTPGVCTDDAEGRPEALLVNPIRLYHHFDDGHWRQWAEMPLPDVAPRAGYGSALASDGPWLVAGAPEWDYRPQEPAPHGAILGPGRVFVYDLATLDADGDTMPDAWERRFGLDPLDPADAVLDADGDGRTNAEEHAAFSHPANDPALTRYFAEGAASGTFETRLAFVNPGAADAHLALRFLTGAGETHGESLTVPAQASAVVVVNDLPGMAEAEFSTTIESDVAVVADRRMTWPRGIGYGAHVETALPGPASTWYLAEGATHGVFDLFYLLQNPNDRAARVKVRYLRPDQTPLEKTYTLAPASRTTLWVDYEGFGDLGRALAATDVSAVVESLDGLPVVVERAMYAGVPGQRFGAGHGSAGVTAPAAEWFIAEGATGPYFDLFVLVANPGVVDATLEVTYLLPDGTRVVKPHRAPAGERVTIWVDLEDPRLEDTAVSTIVRSVDGVPVVVERSMWWPGPTPGTWHGAHAAGGATAAGSRWVIADGEVDAAHGLETYILVANVSDAATTVRVTLLFEGGSRAERTFVGVAAHSRFNVPVGHHFAEASGRRFGAVVEGVGAPPASLVVERAVYWDACGQRWAAGGSAQATPVP